MSRIPMVDSSPATNAANIANAVPSSSSSSITTTTSSSPLTMTSDQLALWNSILAESIDSQCLNFLLTYADEFIEGNEFEFVLDGAVEYRKEYDMKMSEYVGRPPHRLKHVILHENLHYFDLNFFISKMDSKYGMAGVGRLESRLIQPQGDIESKMDIDDNRFIGFTEYALFTFQKSFDQFMTARSQLNQQTVDSPMVERMKARIAAYDAGVRSHIPAEEPEFKAFICELEPPRPSYPTRFHSFLKRTCVIQIFMTVLLSLVLCESLLIKIDARRPIDTDGTTWCT